MRKYLLALSILGVLVLGACGDDPSGLADGEGRFTVRLTDSPGDLEEAFIMVDRIRLLGTTDDDESETLDFEPEETGWIDLLSLSGGQALALVDGEGVAAGQYHELRLYLVDAWVRLKDGRVFATSGADLPDGVTSAGELKCPSCSQSGFKVKFMNGGVEVDEDESTTVTLDFDVGQSFGHEAGQSGKWIMHPVLRATTNTVNFGRLTGTVTLAQGVTLPTCGGAAFALTGFQPVLTLSGESYTGVVAANGALTFATLQPGTYTLPTSAVITFTNGDTLTLGLTPTPASVIIADWGQAVTANFVVTSAVCTPKS
jgi:hypothetical protein